jgi:S-adenosylmethionine:diacylglycerol 3-amino-3-carboxypropyl transferase
MKVQDDDLFVGSHASEEVIATFFAMDSGVRKGGRYGVQRTKLVERLGLMGRFVKAGHFKRRVPRDGEGLDKLPKARPIGINHTK